MIARHGAVTAQDACSHIACRLVWWLACCTVFVAPLPLGSNRPWIWLLLAVVQFLAVAVFLLFAHRPVIPGRSSQRLLFVLLSLFALLPLVQVMPLPIGLLQSIGPGSASAWAGGTANAMATISVEVATTLSVGLRQAGAVALALVMLRLFRDRDIRWRFVDLLTVVGLVNALLGISQFFVGQAVVGTYANKNHFAGLLGMVLPFAVAALLRRWRQCRRQGVEWHEDARLMMHSAAAFVLAVALVMAGSRGGVAASALALFVVLVLFAASGSHLVRMLSRLAMVAAVGVVLVAALVGVDDVSSIYKRGFNNERLIQWYDTLRMAPDYWLLGSGVGTYDYVYPAFKSPELHYPRFNHAHNDYLEILTTTGVIGLVLFVVSLAVVARVSIRRAVLGNGIYREAMQFGAMWAVLTVLFHSLVDFNLQIPANFLIFTLILVLLASRSSGAPGHHGGEH